MCVALYSLLAAPGDRAAFTALLLRDSEEMASEKQTRLSKIDILVLLLLSQPTPVRFLWAELPLK